LRVAAEDVLDAGESLSSFAGAQNANLTGAKLHPGLLNERLSGGLSITS
jgi:hypothetical protein